MRKFSLVVLAAAVACAVIRGADWPSQNGSPQRDGWAKSEKAFNKENAGKIELLYKYKADNEARGRNALTTPIINGRLITYLGFKEMLVFGGSSDNVFSVDADLNRTIWKAHFPWKAEGRQAAPTATCPGGLTATPVMPGSSTAAVVRGTPTPGRFNSGIFATGFGRAGIFIAVSGDGFLHALNTSTGADRIPPVKFLPPNANAGSLMINDGVILAATQGNCGGNPNALYALDMSSDESKLSVFDTAGSGFAGSAGTAIGSDGTVFGQVRSGHGDTAGDYNDTVLALSKDLKLRDYFTPSGKPGAAATPVVFSWKGTEFVVAGGADGRIFLLDAKSLGGADHHTPVAEANAGGEIDSFASWEDADANTRWIYASRPRDITAFQLEEVNGKPVLKQAWTSREMVAPAAPVTANGLVFGLSTGDKPGGRAMLYVLDGSTGKELYSSGNAATAFAHNSGLAVANRRIYFTTHDNTVYCFGFMAEQPQLTGR